MSSTAIVSNLQNINPSAIIELFTLQLDNSLHGATTVYRFHNGSSLKDNGEIVQFELASVFDLAGIRAPKRQCTRSDFPSIGTFNG